MCVLSIILMGKNPQKSAYPLHIPTLIIAYIIVWSMEINKLGDAVLVILLVIPRYIYKYYFIFTQ